VSALPSKADMGLIEFANQIANQPHNTGRYWTSQVRIIASKNGEQEQTVSDCTAHADTRVLELENRCAGNRTVGSNPTLSANVRLGSFADISKRIGALFLLTPVLLSNAISSAGLGCPH